MDGQNNGEQNNTERQKKSAKIKRGVLIGTLAVAAVILLVGLPLIVICHGCGLF